MRAAQEKVKNVASSAKEQLDIAKAKAEEKAEKATARTHDEKAMAEEREKAKESGAKMELHQDKARHAAEKHQASHLTPGAAVDPVTGSTVPSYPLGGHPPGRHHHH